MHDDCIHDSGFGGQQLIFRLSKKSSPSDDLMGFLLLAYSIIYSLTNVNPSMESSLNSFSIVFLGVVTPTKIQFSSPPTENCHTFPVARFGLTI